MISANIQRPNTPSASPRIIARAAPFGFAAGLIWAAIVIFQHWSTPIDGAEALTRAGALWLNGLSPYGDDLAARAPLPNWSLPAMLVGAAGPQWGSRLMMAANLGFALAACVIQIAVLRSYALERAPKLAFASWAPTDLVAICFFIIISGVFGSAALLNTTTPALFLGLNLLLFGIARKHLYAGAFGFALLLLSPLFALLAAPGLGLSAYGRRALFAGVLIAFLMMAPAFIVTPAPEIMRATGLSAPDGFVGAGAFLTAFGAPDLGAGFFAMTALLFACFSAVLLRKARPAPSRLESFAFVFMVALVAAPLPPGGAILWTAVAFAPLASLSTRHFRLALFVFSCFAIWRLENPAVGGIALAFVAGLNLWGSPSGAAQSWRRKSLSRSGANHRAHKHAMQAA